MKMAEQQGLKIVKYSGDLISEHTCCRQVALTSKITENPEDYKKFSRALIKAYGFYQNKKTETVDMISKYVKIDKDIIEAETYGGHISSNPDPDKEGIVKFWGMMNEAGYISSDKNIKDYINTDIYSQAIGELLQEDPGNPVYKKLKSEFKNGRN
jgi:NitT/TauT family transport system substrate-binding protein